MNDIKFIVTIEVVDPSKDHRTTFISIAHSLEELIEVLGQQHKSVVNHLWVPEDV
jgi:hypothetical protein